MCAHPCEGAAHVGCLPCTALCKAPATRSGQLRSAGLQVLTGRSASCNTPEGNTQRSSHI